MAEREQQPRPDLDRLARRICTLLLKHPLLLADGLLDEARRFAFTSALSGSSDETVVAQLGTPSEAVGIGGLYIGLSLEEVQRLDAITRLNLWTSHFAILPGTRFGAGFASAMEEARRYENEPGGTAKPN